MLQRREKEGQSILHCRMYTLRQFYNAWYVHASTLARERKMAATLLWRKRQLHRVLDAWKNIIESASNCQIFAARLARRKSLESYFHSWRAEAWSSRRRFNLLKQVYLNKIKMVTSEGCFIYTY